MSRIRRRKASLLALIVTAAGLSAWGVTSVADEKLPQKPDTEAPVLESVTAEGVDGEIPIIPESEEAAAYGIFGRDGVDLAIRVADPGSGVASVRCFTRDDSGETTLLEQKFDPPQDEEQEPGDDESQSEENQGEESRSEGDQTENTADTEEKPAPVEIVCPIRGMFRDEVLVEMTDYAGNRSVQKIGSRIVNEPQETHEAASEVKLTPKEAPGRDADGNRLYAVLCNN